MKLTDKSVYQIAVRSFTEEGTIAAAAEHLSKIAELGIDIIYLCPIVEAEGGVFAFERRGDGNCALTVVCFCADGVSFDLGSNAQSPCLSYNCNIENSRLSFKGYGYYVAEF